MAQMKLEHNGMTPAGTELYLLNMGPQHPSTHGVLRVLLELDGETVPRFALIEAEPAVIGQGAAGNRA